jgi:NADP-dependent 3-hydroxy acid dehydrogenase YdfG
MPDSENGERPEVVVITGASAGVGRAAARHFARQGFAVALLARGQEGLRAAQREIEEMGGQALMIPTDVADSEAVEEAAETVERELGPIDIWVNNAMTTILAPLWRVTAEEFRRATEVTYLGTVYGTMAALKRMMPRNRGVIVQVGSALARRSIPLQSAYCGAKHGIAGFTDSLRSELIHEGSAIKVTMVQLPAINTPQFGWMRNRLPRKAQPVPPIFQPEVAAEAVYYAAHHPRREMMVGWSTMKAVLGEKVIPGLLDHYLASKAYEGQQTSQKRNPRRRDNLWEPIHEDRGARGEFDQVATDRSPALWIAKRRDSFLIGGAAIALATVWLGIGRRR